MSPFVNWTSKALSGSNLHTLQCYSLHFIKNIIDLLWKLDFCTDLFFSDASCYNYFIQEKTWPLVTTVSIDSSSHCCVDWMKTMSASAAARSTVLGEKGSLCQSNPLAKTGVPDASAVMIHTERGLAIFLYLGSPLTLSFHWQLYLLYFSFA